MKYKVSLGWNCSFIFDEPDVAMNFAVNAIKYRNPDDLADFEAKIEIIIPENIEEVENND